MKSESHFSKSALVKMLRGWVCTSIVLLLSALLFTSCENFLKSTEVAQEIRDSIAYNNAKSLRVRVIANEGTGSTIPSGEHQPKQGYKFEISFTENAGYSFLKWIAVDKDDATQIITNGVFFEDPTKLVTNVIITADSDRIRLLPLCAKRIAIDREPSPGYVANGVSRDRSIFVEFTKDLSAESFIFDESEIPAGAETKTDENGNIWSYTIDSKTYLKNISITNQDDYSIAEHFLQPQIDGKMLTVAVNKSKPIEFESGILFKTVKVTLSGNIKDTEGITMNANKTWRYQITESTDDKAEVVLTSNATEGSVYLAGSKEYSIGQKIPLSFTENKDYQFVKWRYDKKYIHVDKENEADTYALVLDKTDGLNPTIIEAVCAERLRVAENGFSPVNTSAEPTVSKNSSIVITFTKDLPVDAEGISQLENITIAVGGSPVRNSFLSPVVNANTITFAADKTNMLDVPQGQTKTVSVTIPSDFYYQLEDGTKVTYGANGKSFDYKIDSTTLDKAEINFTAATGSGTITPAAGSANHYSIGQEVPLSFVPADGWKFNGWTITSGGTAVDETKIKIADKNALSTKLVVYDSLQGITVTANTSECLKIRSYSPSGNNNHKDSDIEITFNKPLAQECSNLLNRIRVSSDGNNFDSYYEARSLSDDRKTIILKNTSAISVPKGSVKNIIVTVPEELYYNDGNVKINLSEETFSFTVNYETTAKSNVTYKIINGETNQEFSSANAAGTHNHRDSEQYNIGEEVELSFDLNSGYQFYGWSIIDSTGAVVTDSVSFKNSNSSDPQAVLIINKPAEELKINAVCYKRPVISTASISPYDANTSNQVAKNTPIVLRFDHAIKPETKDEIIVSYSLSNFSKTTYYSTTISSDNKTITLKPIRMLPLNNSFETVTVTVPHEKIYYLASDGKTKITPADEDFTWSYRINSSTVQKTSVRFATTEAAVSGRQITVGSTFLSSGTKQDMNEEQTLNLEFPAYTDYKFAGWKVDVGTTAGYTVNPSGYTTKGTITVTAGEKTFFSLTIDNSDPAKATAYSNEYIGSGTDGWGITISAKDVLFPKVTDHTGKGITAAIEKDSDIEITFNKPLAQECADLLNKISVSSDGYSIDSYYTNRTLSDDGTKITIKNTTPISIPKGTSKIITVKVPSDLYDAEANVNEESFSFTIDYKTKAKTNLSFATNDGTATGRYISVNGETFLNGSNKDLYVEESFNLEYPVSEGYAFAGWKVAVTGDYTVSTSSYVTNGSITVKNGNIPYFILVIDSDNPSKATAYSYDAIGSGITVSAKDVVLPKVTSVTPSASVNPKDSNIVITFNKNLAADCSTLLNNIRVTMGGNSVDSFFETRTLNANVITLNNTQYLDVTGNTSKTVTVTIPADFYYMDSNFKAKMKESYSFNYTVNSTSNKKLSVSFYASTGTVTPGSETQYNLGDVIDLKYNPESGYRFRGWSYYWVNASGVRYGDIQNNEVVIDDVSSASTKLRINQMPSDQNIAGVNVSANAYQIPVVDSIQVKATSNATATNILNTSSAICDSKIYINFNKPVDTSSVTLSKTGSLSITKAGSSTQHYENYFSSSWANSNKQLILTPDSTIKDLVPDNSDIFEFVIKLNANGNQIKDTSGYVLETSSAINNSFEIPYTIKGQRETVLPNWYSTSYLYSDNTSSKKTMSTTAFGSWSSSATSSYPYGTYSQNHVGESVYFSIYGYDYDSGVKALRITETYYKTDVDTSVGTVSGVTDCTEKTLYSSSYNGIYKFTGTYTFKTNSDGVIKLDFQIVDNAGNVTSNKTWYVIKDTQIDIDNYAPYLDLRTESNYTDSVSFVIGNGTDSDKFFKKSNFTNGFFGNTTIEVYWGYDQTSMTKISATTYYDYNNRYSFSHDPNRLTYIKIKGKDEGGNIKERYFAIPVITEVNSSVISGNYCTITPNNAAILKSLANSIGADSFVVNYFLIEDGKTISWDNATDWQDSNDNENSVSVYCSSLSNGKTYRAYLRIGFKYNDGSTIYSSLSHNYATITVSSSGTYTTSVVTPASSGGSLSGNYTSYIDEPLYVNYTKASGSYKVDIDLTKCTIINSKLNTYTYTIEAKNTSTNEVYIQQGTSINLPSGTFKIYVSARNSSGQSIKSTWLYVRANGATSNANDLTLPSADLTPPDMGKTNSWYTYAFSLPSALTLFYQSDWSNWYGYPRDASSSLKNTITYYIMPGTATYSPNMDLSSYTAKTVTFNTSQTSWTLPHNSSAYQGVIQLPYGDIDEGLYKVYVIAEDSNGNKSGSMFTVSNRIKNAKMSLDYNSSTKKITVTQNMDGSLYYYDTNKSRWVYLTMFDQSNYHSYTDSNGSLTGKWVRVSGCYPGNDYAAYYDTEYRYIGTTTTIYNKNIMELQNGLQVFCDNSTFVHTMYSTRKLTETNTASDIAIWETKGLETGIKTASSNFTYGSENLNGVPSGCYYTTIVHFRDGTTLMGEVKQK